MHAGSGFNGGMRLVLDIEANHGEPVQGWLELGERERLPFMGFLELIAALERVLAPGEPG